MTNNDFSTLNNYLLVHRSLRSPLPARIDFSLCRLGRSSSLIDEPDEKSGCGKKGRGTGAPGEFPPTRRHFCVSFCGCFPLSSSLAHPFVMVSAPPTHTGYIERERDRLAVCSTRGKSLLSLRAAVLPGVRPGAGRKQAALGYLLTRRSCSRPFFVSRILNVIMNLPDAGPGLGPSCLQVGLPIDLQGKETDGTVESGARRRYDTHGIQSAFRGSIG